MDSGPIGTSSHAEAAADAAMVVHHHDSVFLAFEGRLGRADADTGRIVAVVAQNHDRSFLQRLIEIRVFLFRENGCS